jgi:hypothetical protein
MKNLCPRKNVSTHKNAPQTVSKNLFQNNKKNSSSFSRDENIVGYEQIANRMEMYTFETLFLFSLHKYSSF